MSFKVFFTGFLNKKTYPKSNFIIEQFFVDKHDFDKKNNFKSIDFTISSKELNKNFIFLSKKKTLYKKTINNFLKKKFYKKKNYWDSSVDYWLIHFISSIHIKYQKLKKLKKKYPNLKVFKIDSKYLHDINQTRDFIELAETSDSLNVFIYQKIAEVLNIKLIDSNFKGSSKPKLLKNRDNIQKSKSKNSLIKKIKFLFIYFYCLIRKPYLLIDIYSSKKFIINCLLFSFGKFLPISSESIYLNEQFRNEQKILNSESIYINEIDEFDCAVNNVINYCFPKNLLLSYDLEKFYFLKKIKGIINSVNISSQDNFRFVISILDKKKIYTLQHGGLYELQRKHLHEDFEKKYSIFLGWNKLFSKQAFFSHKFINKPPYEQNKKITLFTAVKNINASLYEYENNDFVTNNDFVKNQFVFYKNLNNRLRNKLTVRNPKETYNWDLKKLWFKQSREFSGNLKTPNFFNLDSSEMAIANSRIFVCESISTPLFEAMHSGIPILIYDNLKKYEFKNKTLKLLLELKKNNIIHNNPEECAAFINKHYDSIDNWWCDKKTKRAINNFKKYIFASDNHLALSNLIR